MVHLEDDPVCSVRHQPLSHQFEIQLMQQCGVGMFMCVEKKKELIINYIHL